MSITGSIKFFKRSKNLFSDNAFATGSTGNDSASRALDKNVFTYWRSVGSTDSITETMTINFPASSTIDRIFLIDHNFKEFTVKYDLSGVYTDFTSVIGIDGTLAGGISETTFSEDTAYYEFSPVTTTSIQISILKTQVPSVEKYLNQVISTEEIGTLKGYPIIKRIRPSRNLRVKKMLSGRVEVSKSEDLFLEIELDFKNYPGSLQSDFDIILDLDDSEDDFLIWLSGGRRGTPYFKTTLRGFRLKDVIPMQIIKDIDNSYTKNVYQNTWNAKVGMGEHV